MYNKYHNLQAVIYNEYSIYTLSPVDMCIVKESSHHPNPHLLIPVQHFLAL